MIRSNSTSTRIESEYVPSETVHRAVAKYVAPATAEVFRKAVAADDGDRAVIPLGFDVKSHVYVLAAPVPPVAVIVTVFESMVAVADEPKASPLLDRLIGIVSISTHVPPERALTEVMSTIDPPDRRLGAVASTHAPPDLRLIGTSGNPEVAVCGGGSGV